MHLVTCAGVLKKDDDILTLSWFCLVSVLRGPMGLCRNAFTFHSFIKMYVHFFGLFYIHSFIHFLCPVLLHSGGAGVVPQLSPGVKAGSRHEQVASFVFRFSPKNVFKWQWNCPPFSVNISHTVTAKRSQKMPTNHMSPTPKNQTWSVNRVSPGPLGEMMSE